MYTVKIKQGTIVTMNKTREIIKGDIFIEEDKITDINSNIEKKADIEIDAKGKVIIPGLIQTHIHLTQSLFKGKSDDLELLDWLQNRIWPLEGSHTYESNYVSAKLGIAELIMGGTTSIIDMGTVHHTNAVFEAIKESGLRALAGKCMMDYGENVPNSLMETSSDSLKESISLLKKWHNTCNGRIKYCFAPRFVISCTEDLLIQVKNLSDEYGVSVHTHASENRKEIDIVENDRGMRNINYLHKLGLTGENIILAHCIWLNDEEMKILKETGTKIVHCPTCNLKVASGIAKIPELIKMGCNVSIGADGSPANNNLDMFKEMRTAAIIQKARLFSPTVMPAKQVFEMATIGGAKAMGMENEIGSLEIGKKADLAILNLNNIQNSPCEGTDIISQLVYSTSACDVETTLINGQVVMLNRNLLTLNEKSIIEDSNRLIKEQMKKISL